MNKENKDWTGNTRSVFMQLGASNHTLEDREKNDYYATEPAAIDHLISLESFDNNILEPACGEGHMSEALKKLGYNVFSSDIIDRGYGHVLDFLSPTTLKWKGDIITNPPYKYAEEFVRKALDLVDEGHKVAMFLRIQFLEGKNRKCLFEEANPKNVYVSSSRLKCAKNGDFERYSSSAQCYAWFVWVKGYKGNTIIKWFN